MTSKLKSNLEVTVNVIIAVAVVIVAGIAVKNYFHKSTAARLGAPSAQIVAGARIIVPDVNWQENQKTLVFFLKKDCKFCTASAPFYRQLIAEALKRNVKLLAIVPNSIQQGREYISSLGLPIEDIKTGSLTAYKISGTPTVLLVDNQGTVRSVWVGGVSPEREQEIKDNLIPLFEAKPVLVDVAKQALSAANNTQTQTGIAASDIDAAELRKILEQKQRVTIVDVDEREDYRKEHIPNAKNIPSDEISLRAIREISKDNLIVIYCRCIGEGASNGAKSELMKQGYSQVSVLKGGLASWKSIALPTSSN